jgi:hypothetical protein
MKRSFFQKVMFCLIMAIGVFSFGSVCAETVMAYTPPDFLTIIEAGSPVLAMGALTIPSYDMSKLCAVTQTVFKDLQSRFGKLYVIDVSVDTDESYQFLLRRPTRQHLEIIESYKGDVTKTNDFIIKNLVVAGNETGALDDGVVFAQFNAETAKIIQQGQAFLSKA